MGIEKQVVLYSACQNQNEYFKLYNFSHADISSLSHNTVK